MKKQLLSIVAAMAVGTVSAQSPSPDWSINQNAIFPTALPNTGVKFMDAVDANVVWVTGWDLGALNRAYNWYSRSIDGGATFNGGNIFPDTNTYVISNMEAIDANTAWVCSYMKAGGGGMGAIHRTTNGGANWVNMSATGMFTDPMSFGNWVTFLTPSVGIANGDPINGEFELWRTTDGGNSWSLTPGSAIPNPLSVNEYAIVNLYAKVGSSNLWFGTNGNRIFRTTDAGLTYSVSSIGPLTNTIVEIAFSSPMEGVVYMINSGGAMELWNTSDGGIIWGQVTPMPANIGLFDVTAVPGTGYLVSYGAGNNSLISYSSDNGVTWTDWGSTDIQYVTGDFVDGNTGWAGSFDFTGPLATVTDVWKYSGPGLTGTVIPTAAFTLPANLCLSGPTATVQPINNSIGSPAATYSWSVLPAGATISNDTDANPIITFSSANNYTVILVATNAVGSHTATSVIDVAACTAPVAVFTIPASACSNFSFATTNASTGAPAPTYSWVVTPATGVTLSPSPVAASPSIRIAGSGIYSVTLIVSNASGTAQTTHTINNTACPPVQSFTLPSSICFASPSATFMTGNVTTNPSGITGNITHTWSILPTSQVAVAAPGLVAQNIRVTVTNSATVDYTVTLRSTNASGTSTLSQVVKISVCDDTGINEANSLEQNVSIFPNPAHEHVNVMLPASASSYKIKVTNVLGSVVYEEKAVKHGKEATVINLANKPKGVYFLTIESDGEKMSRKIVVE